MSKTFNTQAKINSVKEPLFQRNRMRYRGVRSSEQENLETNLIKLDLTRIKKELENIDVSILEDITLFVGNRYEITQETNLDDGLSYTIDGIDFQYFSIHDGEIVALGLPIEEDLSIDTIDKLSGQLSRILLKVQRLEAEKNGNTEVEYD